MCEFVKYIKTLKPALGNLKNFTIVHLVLGNEACDLDSSVSSIVYAFFLTKYKYGNEPKSVVVPVLNVPEEEFVIRKENCFVLNKTGIALNELVYRDQINFQQLLQQTTVVTTLVDHHVLRPLDIELFQSVEEIFDHRPIDKSVNWTNVKKLNISLVASCSTLIANEYLDLSEDDSFANISKTAAKLLLDTIIYDSVALKPDIGKTKPLDESMVEKLSSILAIHADTFQSIFDELWTAHCDISELTNYQILLKDYKVIGDVYIAGLPMLVSDFIKTPGFSEGITQFWNRKQAKLVILMGLKYSDPDNTVYKDLALYNLNNNREDVVLVDTIRNVLEQSVLQLEQVIVDTEYLLYFKQNNIKLSRKQVLPIIKAIIEIK